MPGGLNDPRWPAQGSGGQFAPRVEPGTVQPSSRRAPQRQAAEPDLAGLFPDLRKLPGFFWKIAVPGGLSIPTGRAAVFCFAQYECGAETNGEGMIVGASVDMRPCDTTGSGDTGQFVAWGDTAGETAALVVGVGLNLTYNTWVSRVVHHPGVIDAAAFHVSARGAETYPLAVSFPSGKRTDTTPQQKQLEPRFLPVAQAVRDGETIQFALVVSREYVDGLAGARTLKGMVRVDLHWMPFRRDRRPT